VGGLLQLRLQFGDGAQRLGGNIIEVEDDERGLLLAVLAHTFVEVFLGLDEFDFHVHLARRLLDLCQEEQILDERKNASWAGLRGHGQGFGFGQHELFAEALVGAAATDRLMQVAVVVALRGAVAVVHGRAVNAGAGLVLPPGPRAVLAAVAFGRPIAVLLSGLLGSSGIGNGATAAAPRSASFSSGLPRGRVRSLIHASLLIVVTRRWRAPTFVNRSSWPHTLNFSGGRRICDGYFAEIESVASVWRLAISARGTPAREVRRLED